MTASATRIGILGGTFDPIHRGHLDLANAAWSALGLTTLYLVPAHDPPHRSAPVASSYHRFAMVALSVAGRPGWIASDIELRNDQPSYTATTLRAFHESGFDSQELFFITGADAFKEIATWKDYPAILDEAHFAVVSRPGCTVGELAHALPALAARMTPPPVRASDATSIFLIDALTTDVSSTAIRQRCARGQDLGDLVPGAVKQHIEQHGLYVGSGASPDSGLEPSRPAAGRMHGES